MSNQSDQFNVLINIFEGICHLPMRHKANVIANLNDKIIQSICICISAVIMGNRLTEKQKSNLREKLYPIHSDLRCIADDNISIDKKRKLLVRHISYINYILETVIPLLSFPSAVACDSESDNDDDNTHLNETMDDEEENEIDEEDIEEGEEEEEEEEEVEEEYEESD